MSLDSGALTVLSPAFADNSIALPIRPSTPHTLGAVYGRSSTAAMPVANSFDRSRGVAINTKFGCTRHRDNPSPCRRVPATSST